MGALSTIKKAGFDVTLVAGFIEISPASSLSATQRDYLKIHKAEIITELQERQSGNDLIKCRDCLRFKCFNQHGQGAGTCNAGVQPNGAAWWSETPHKCEIYDAAVEWIQLPEQFSPNALIVQCYTPNGKLIEIEAIDAEHAKFLRRMNPKRIKAA
jgi:hypothetical protein